MAMYWASGIQLAAQEARESDVRDRVAHEAAMSQLTLDRNREERQAFLLENQKKLEKMIEMNGRIESIEEETKRIDRVDQENVAIIKKELKELTTSFDSIISQLKEKIEGLETGLTKQRNLVRELIREIAELNAKVFPPRRLYGYGDN